MRPGFIALLCALAMACVPDVAAQGFSLPSFGTSSPADDALQKVVIVSRHGVRSSPNSPGELASWASQPWPAWGQAVGTLTPRGAQLAILMGRYYREYVGANHLLPAAGCPAPGSLYVYADSLERTQGTAKAIISGFANDCGFEVRSRGGTAIDPMFHPLAAGVCKLDPMMAQTRVLERTGGDLNRTARDLKSSFTALQAVLECCKPTLCSAFNRGDKCELADLPTAMVVQADGSGMSLLGALAIASTTSELLLNQYVNNMPLADVGWGRAQPAQLRDTLRLHTEEFDLMQRTPYLARRMGSALLTKVAAAVTSARSLGFGVVDPAVREAKVVAFVGHDTNIWNLGGMLGVSWSQPGYQRNMTPPNGALTFEVRETKDKKLVVYTSYVAQSLEQLRNATVLTMEVQPARTPLKIAGCGTDRPGFPCPIEEFAAAMRSAIDRDCVE